MIRRLFEARLRMIDAVAVAAAALLALKIVEVAFAPPAAPEPPPGQVGVADRGDLPAFAQVLARARMNYAPPDAGTTGAVSPKPGRAEEDQEPAKALPGPGAPPAKSASVASILERLGERRESLERRDRDIDTRERLLEDAEKKLEARIGELKSLEKNDPAAKQRGEADKALQGVVTMYEAMKPKDAARVFDRLPLDVLVPLVAKMSPRKMAEVLAVMQPDSAERLTVALAGRAKNPDGAPRPAPPPDLPASELPAIDPPPATARKQP